MRDFEDNCMAGFAIMGLVDGRHPTSFDEGRDLKSIIENLTNLDCVAQRPLNATRKAVKKSLRFR
jgi:hypothetical protein